MKTPKEFIKNLKNKVITETMLDACLYSVNKRAKNHRDNAHYYHQESRYGAFFNDLAAEREEKAKDEMYAAKDRLLKLETPIAIHTETYTKCFRDYDEEEGETFDTFFDDEFSYLYYEIGEHSYHSPMDDKKPSDFPNLPVIELDDNIATEGADCSDLISLNFIRKVLILIESEFTYIKSNGVSRLNSVNDL